MRAFSRFLAAAVLLVAPSAFAHEYKVGDIKIGHPWTRATPPSARVGGGYLNLTNHGQTEDRLVGGSSLASGRVEIHTMEVTDGVMKMRALPDGLALPPGETVKLEPGGYHLMLIDLKAPIREGAKIPVTLRFEHAGTVDVELAAGALGAPAMEHGDHGAQHGHGVDGQASAGGDEHAIEHVMKSIWDSKESPLDVAPVVVAGDYALAGWVQAERGGRALLRRHGHEWRIVLCSGDDLKSASNLVKAGLPQPEAEALSGRLADAEAKLDPKVVARFSLFEGMVRMDEQGNHGSGHGKKH
ncbi:copper uptake system-associated protein [Kaistia terrae]|uniref:Copper uptake system-associated protein n=1 Tax=Kaistia terrae TaxID=537017 RepID=A0ABW0PXW8_9HYPH|nr:copper uptake system-associated protein [Kaistia terrae]MCX5581647.1 copper uptake system-associated protein [Kaistia terrae]